MIDAIRSVDVVFSVECAIATELQLVPEYARYTVMKQPGSCPVEPEPSSGSRDRDQQ